MMIQITEKHIKEGLEGNCRYCPTALAINDVLNDNYYAVVRPGFIYLNHKVKAYVGKELETPETVYDFIKYFDKGYNVAPLSFHLDIPQEMLRGT